MAVGATTLVTALFILNTALRPDPWYDPRYVIALVGIVLGSVLNAASLALDGMLAGASREKLAIEARISLGAAPAGLRHGAARVGATRHPAQHQPDVGGGHHHAARHR